MERLENQVGLSRNNIIFKGTILRDSLDSNDEQGGGTFDKKLKKKPQNLRVKQLKKQIIKPTFVKITSNK